ncbi:MAG: alpha/beta hydrolase [Coriobacteriia bacterium]|nr:alpha/beta hydrolase [Coriobacteriia bacterium]
MIKKIIKIVLIALLVIVLAAAGYLVVLFVQEGLASQETANNCETLPKTTSAISYVDEKTYDTQMKNLVEPYIKKYERQSYLTMEDGAHLRYKVYVQPNAKANIVIAHGLTEFIEKYNEMIYYFLVSGYNVYILEDRGHGESTRYVDDKQLCHVENFYEYVFDFEKFCSDVVDHQKPCYLYAHSMGGAIAACALEDKPNFFAKAVLSSPMIKYSAGDIPNPLAKFFGAFMCKIGQSKQECIGQGRYSQDFDFEGSLDNSEARYKYFHTLCNMNENFQTCAPTYGWLRSASYDLDEMYKPENLAKIKAKCVVIKAGNDNRVKEYGEDHFANCVDGTKLYKVPGVKHEIYMSGNDTLMPYVDTILKFFEG